MRCETKQIHLRVADAQSIAMEENTTQFDIDRAATAVNKVRIQRQGRVVQWTTEGSDLGRSTSGHIIGWTALNVFQKHQDVEDLDSAKFGKITRILKIKVCRRERIFMKVCVFKTQSYRNGGIWVLEEGEANSAIIPIERISEPLISAPENRCVVVLNSKIRVPSLEARIMVDHLTIT